MKPFSEYYPKSREVNLTNLLMLISELEGSYQHLMYMGFDEDMETLAELKKKYYKLYYQVKKNNAL